MALALIVDDEVDLCRVMQMTLKKMKIDTIVAYDRVTAIHHLSEHNFDFCLTDLNLPDGSGLDIVKWINAQYPNMPVAVITAHGSMDLAIEALKLGAFDFVNKPLELPRLRLLVENAVKAGQDAKEQTVETAPDLFAGKLIGNSEPIIHLKQTIQKLARSQAPVFLWGGSGTGKEVVAKLIHELSPRATGNFVPVNCGAIPSELMESEFFGHKKGSFTGATADKEGLFQQAHGGTLFLDEVADLPLAMQVKLLRAIQEKKVRSIGGTQEISVDIRLLSATHKNLAKLVELGEFRQDLYYRMNVIEVKLPSLNERKDDVQILADHFLQMIADDWGLEHPISLSNAAKDALMHHDYLGNVRELRNILERAITLADGQVIDVSHLQLTDTRGNPPSIHAIPAPHTAILPAAIVPHITSQPLLQSTLSQISNPQTRTLADFGTGNNDTASAAKSHTPSNEVTNGLMPTSQTSREINLPKISSNNYNGHNNHTQARQTVNILPTRNLTLKNDTLLKNNNLAQTLPSMPANTPPTHVIQDPPLSVQARIIPKSPNPSHLCIPLPPEGLEAYLVSQEKQLIIAALNQCNWNKTQAAKLLNTSFRSLRYRMKKLEIDDGD